MDTLKKRRTTIKSKSTRLSNIVNKLQESDINVDILNTYKAQINDLWSDLNAVNDEIMEVCSETDINVHETEYDEVATKIELLKITTSKLLRTCQRSGSSQINKTESEHMTVKLPMLQLPTFTGNYLDWISFRDLFMASIDANNSLSSGQKLQYLKLSLKNDAATLLHAVQISDANYEKAWKLLSDRYENKTEIIYATFEKLFSQPNLNSESSTGLQKLLDITNQCLDNLEIMKQPVNQWDAILIYFLQKKLDSESLRQWMLSQVKNELATFKDFREFIDKRAHALSALNVNRPAISAASKLKVGHGQTECKQKRSFASSNHTISNKCMICKQDHSIYKCEEFLKFSHEDKKQFVRKNKLCNNCLRSGHFAYCCTSSFKCKKCNLPHHSLLHEDQSSHLKDEGSNSEVFCENENTPVTNFSRSNTVASFVKEVLLPTAVVYVHGKNGSQPCRALFDSGSQSSFLREDCLQRLGLTRQRVSVNVSGLSSNHIGKVSGAARIQISSASDNNVVISTEALVLSKITCDLPQCEIHKSLLKHLRHLKFADPNCNRPGPIDLLLGADVLGDVLLSGRLAIPGNTLVAHETIFGWIVFGKTLNPNIKQPSVVANHIICDIDNDLRKFWELEEVPNVKPLKPEEKACEEHFLTTRNRDETGRFVVKLPFKENSQPLGASRDVAISRLKQIERRFHHKPHILQYYTEFMREYINLGHMEVIPSHEVNSSVKATYYLPHHCVRKDGLPNDKFRVVFDASAKTSTNVSLNDNLLVGPTIQDNIFDLILRFREHKIALKADISKMYRQINIAKEDADFQRIVWRESPSEDIKDYRLLTVTYGTASAPFLATKCLQQIAIDDGQAYPLAARAALKDFYVDDLISGSDTIEEALQLQTEIISLLKGGGFDLRKWSSNHPSLLVNLNPENLQNNPQQFDSDEGIKTLGVLWSPESDDFSFKVTLKSSAGPATKRKMLSTLCTIFDPLGWMVPSTTVGKILIQELWKTGLNWDDNLPVELDKLWKNFIGDLPNLECIRIPRYIATNDALGYELHGFCDASERAFAAVVYARIINQDGSITTNLVASKSKVAPMKTVSLPRLELCGALLLAKLMKVIIASTCLNFKEIHCWSDSTIVLSWLTSYPSRWKTFVANRVSQIQEMFPRSQWHYVKSEENPADCASRGINPSTLITHKLWWNGPQFLSVPEHTTFQSSDCERTNEVLMEEKKSLSSNVATEAISLEDTFELLHKFSSLSKLTRVTAFCLRFISNCRLPVNKRNLGFLTSMELDNALQFWIRTVQSTEFKEEITCLAKNKPLPCKSRILQLSPFLDDCSILRVGGRLKNSKLSPSQKHPILLPKKHFLTELIIRSYHLTHLHAGLQQLLSLLHQKFWIVSARDIVRYYIRKCVICFRHQTRPAKQLMGDLPSARIQPARPFLRTGVDYCGPFSLRASKGRGRTTFKGYIAVFVCFVTRATHLELVSDLTTEAFIAALKRFISRRGKCSDIYSDCGKNFLGASKKLREIPNLPQSSKHNDVVSHFLTDQGINWHFNPPGAPHMGGLWEAGVKSVKYHLKRIIRDTILSFEEFYTILVQTEACLNSRPLCPASSDPTDLSSLTPGHFLIGDALTATPERDYTATNINHLTRWHLLQKLFQDFWKRWSREYLTRLQQRPKWLRKEKNVQVGELVLIKEDNLPPLKWRLGRIAETFKGQDNCVRVVTIKTAEGLLKRPISKISPLPIEHC